jgi:hypothetical protein
MNKRMNKYSLHFIMLLPLVVYVLFPNRNFSADALHYSIAIEKGNLEALLNPHHLLFNVVGYFAFHLCRFMGISTRAVYLLQLMNSVLGAAGIYILYYAFLALLGWKGWDSRAAHTRFFASLLSLLIAFTAGYWLYAVEAEVYIPAVFFIILAFFILAKSIAANRLSSSTLVSLGILIAFACLFHQTHIFFVPAVLILLSMQNSSFWKGKVLYLLVPLFAIVCFSYLIAGYLTGHLESAGAFYSWITLYAHGGVWGHLRILNIPSSFVGLTRVFVLPGAIKNLVLSKYLDLNVALLLMGSIVFFSMLFINLFRFLLGFPSYIKAHRALVVFYLLWIAPYALFAFWWEPYNQEFWIPVLVPAVGILSIPYIGDHERLLGKHSGWTYLKLTIIFPAILLFLINFTGEILPNCRIKNNERYQLCLKLKELDIGADDLVIMPNDTPLLYYDYFFGIKLKKLSFYLLDEKARDVIEKEIREAKNRHSTILISEAEIEPVRIRSLLKPAKLAADEIAKFYKENLPNLKPIFTYSYDGNEIRMYEFVYRD